MKKEIYHYEASEKFYLGSEIKEDEAGLPAFATYIRPPLELCREGHIPVFTGEGWEVVQDDFWRPRIIERNYDAGRKMSSYEPMNLSMYSRDFPPYPSMPMLCNTFLVTQAICQRIRLIHEKFDRIVKLHNLILSAPMDFIPLDSPDYKKLSSSPTSIYRYKLEVETIVYLMRRILDTLLQLTFLLTDYETFRVDKTIFPNEIGKVLNPTFPNNDLKKVFLGDGATYDKDKTGFLPIINDLFNSFKHCLMHDESFPLLGIDAPTIVSYQAKHNDHKKEIIHHNHNAYHIMMGFQNSVARILKNHRTYYQSKGIHGVDG